MPPMIWSLPQSREPELIAEGDGNMEEEELGVWQHANPGTDYLLRTVLTDGWGRTLVGSWPVTVTTRQLRRSWRIERSGVRE